VPNGTIRYAPFGGLRAGSASPEGIGYTGEWTDPTGLVNLRARAYDPSAARFLSADTYGGEATDPLTANPYAYGIDNPLAYTDPSGHFLKAAVSWVANNAAVIASFAICFVPVIGQAYMIGSAVAGQDLLTGTKLSGPERFLFALGGLALAAKAVTSLAKIAGPMFKALGRFSSGLGKLFSGVKDGQLAARVGEMTSSIRASMGEGVFARALSAVGNTAREIGSAIGNKLSRWVGRGNREVSQIDREVRAAALRAKVSVDAVTPVANRVGSAYGSRVHAALAREIRALGNPRLRAEISYLGRQEVRGRPLGHIRPDVVFGEPNAPRAVWDLKTGSATLDADRIQEIQGALPPGFGNIPIIEVHP